MSDVFRGCQGLKCPRSVSADGYRELVKRYLGDGSERIPGEHLYPVGGVVNVIWRGLMEVPASREEGREEGERVHLTNDAAQF